MFPAKLSVSLCVLCELCVKKKDASRRVRKGRRGRGMITTGRYGNNTYGTANMTTARKPIYVRNTFDLLHMNAEIDGMGGIAGHAGCT